ncbi:hypothetical protein DPEC_G00299380 [Dallia pectoralis]|uniref:Uncharacterized protein n=1 Tax=Dallia pectoralis TaxID=75939 RepID=A0ACC2FG93_DALPE|nr:hypothetical protein DPEC_G00299380 [Dallia pectoralis]
MELIGGRTGRYWRGNISFEAPRNAARMRNLRVDPSGGDPYGPSDECPHRRLGEDRKCWLLQRLYKLAGEAAVWREGKRTVRRLPPSTTGQADLKVQPTNLTASRPSGPSKAPDAEARQ